MLIIIRDLIIVALLTVAVPVCIVISPGVGGVSAPVKSHRDTLRLSLPGEGLGVDIQMTVKSGMGAMI